MNIKVVVCTHKKYEMPSDSMYLPVQSGSSIYPDLGYQRDDDGENISNKNAAYNIMCVKYWAWKNLNVDYIGIAHYRRHFSFKKGLSIDFNNVLTKDQAIKLFEDCDILVSPKRYYPFYTIETHYTNTKGGYKKIHKRDLQVLREVLSEYYKEYLIPFETVMKRNYYHSGSLFLMKKNLYDDYCDFIFSIGFEVEKRLINERPDLNRYIASLTELLLDVWIIKHNYNFKEIGIIEFEKPIFLKKLFFFLLRKFTGYYKGTIKYKK